MAWKVKVGKKWYVKDYVLFNGEKKIKPFGVFEKARIADSKILQLNQERIRNNNKLIDYDATLWKTCDAFLKDPIIQRQPGTWMLYEFTINKHLKNFYKSRNISNPLLRDITEDEVKEFVIFLKTPQRYRKKPTLAHGTIHRILREWHCILEFDKKHLSSGNPITNIITAFGKPEGNRMPLSPEELDRLLNAALQIRVRKLNGSLMLWRMIKTLYATGVRLGELLNMDKDDMVSEYEIEIKSRTQRRVRQAQKNPTKSAIPYIMDLNDEIAPFFWEVESGPIWPGWKKRNFEEKFELAAKLANVIATPHTMRHTFAKDTLRSGKTSLPELQAMLNHQDSKSTDVYTRWTRRQRFRENVNALIRPNIKKVI